MHFAMVLLTFVCRALLGDLFGEDDGAQVCRRSDIQMGIWHYCGPSNGRNFQLEPWDVLDATCAQHDYCIEKSTYWVEGLSRTLYPIGELDERDEYKRCGIPMRSHTNPAFGCQISKCDREMLRSLQLGFKCSDNPDLPKSKWCSSERFLGKSQCVE